MSGDILADLKKRLETALDQILTVLAPLAEERSEVGGKEFSPGAEGDFEMLLATLADSIGRADPEEIRTHTAEVKRLLVARMIDPSVFQTLETQIRRYDYDQALETIQHIRDAVEHRQ